MTPCKIFRFKHHTVLLDDKAKGAVSEEYWLMAVDTQRM